MLKQIAVDTHRPPDKITAVTAAAATAVSLHGHFHARSLVCPKSASDSSAGGKIPGA